MSTDKPVAIVDIGSNSVRLVVYSGATRAPSVLFNEKVMAGLGRGIDATGALAPEAQVRAVTAMSRFRLLVDRIGVVRTRVFATAAVREAANGADFLRRVGELGFEPMILSGEEEARLAALGVVSGNPAADGVIGDLGGGSLELADIGRGDVRRRVSLPLGVLRIAAMDAKSEAVLLRRIGQVLDQADFAGIAGGRPFYMVGGSWRALARLDLDITGHPLPITHQHELAPERPQDLQRAIAALLRRDGKVAPTGSRTPTLPNANLLLRAVVERLRPSRLVASAYGVREGLLYDDLDEETRRRDPLIEAARSAGASMGRYPQHGELLDRWIAPVFDDSAAAARLRLTACLLSDIGWAAHPDFRAERGVDMALHGNWVAIDAAGRVMLAQALYATFGGGGDLPYPDVAELCTHEELLRARHWGLAIRLAQRLSAGVAEPLARSSLAIEGDRLVLWLPEEDSAMFGESVERRLKTLAHAIGKRPDFLFG
jgi:exopolyphosphatase / guanosine-5'-triphosphate,3'-diphosphate pyrophosphatase